jgi:hypothetical protein
MLQFGRSGVMEVSRSWALRYLAAALLRSTIVIIRVTQWLYNHRLISYKATRYFFRVAKKLDRHADRPITRKKLVRLKPRRPFNFRLRIGPMTSSELSQPKGKPTHPLAMRIARHWAPRDPPRRGFLAFLGPGLITGASDDDPSGIATYSQVGAQFGYSMAWVMLFSYR